MRVRTRTRLATTVALVAALVVAVGAIGLGGATTAGASGPGHSNHCPAGSTQVRFETKDVPGTMVGITVTTVSTTVWDWTYDGDMEIGSIHVFGAAKLVQVPDAAGTTEGRLDTLVLGIVNQKGKAQDISHVDFCLVPAPPPPTFRVIPEKIWDFGDATIPGDGLAVITIDAGAHGSKTWTFDTHGAFVGDDTALELPEGAPYTVTETVTEPEGFACERVDPEVEATAVVDEVITVHNRCQPRTSPTTRPTVPDVPDRPDVPQVPDEIETDVDDEVVAPTEPPTDVGGIEVEVPAPEALPRTGTTSASLAIVGLAVLALGGTLMVATRRRAIT